MHAFRHIHYVLSPIAQYNSPQLTHYLLLGSLHWTGHTPGLRIDSGGEIIHNLYVRSYVMDWLAIDKSQ